MLEISPVERGAKKSPFPKITTLYASFEASFEAPGINFKNLHKTNAFYGMNHEFIALFFSIDKVPLLDSKK